MKKIGSLKARPPFRSLVAVKDWGFFGNKIQAIIVIRQRVTGRSAELQLCAAQFVIIAQNWILRSATTHPHY